MNGTSGSMKIVPPLRKYLAAVTGFGLLLLGGSALGSALVWGAAWLVGGANRARAFLSSDLWLGDPSVLELTALSVGYAVGAGLGLQLWTWLMRRRGWLTDSEMLRWMSRDPGDRDFARDFVLWAWVVTTFALMGGLLIVLI